MSQAPTVRLSRGEYRWSLASRCPRQATLHRRGAEARPRSTREQRILARGRLFEQLVADQMAQTYGEENVQRQREFAWPGGLGHSDVFVLTEGAALEVKSSTSPEGLIESAILQNAGEQLFTEECRTGGVVLIDPTDLEQRLVPVNAEEVRDKVDAIVEQIQWAEQTGGLPDCTACNPTECALGKFCQYTDTAWAGWEAPAPVQLDSPEALDIVRELYALRLQRKQFDADAAAMKAGEKAMEAHLTELGVRPGLDYLVGPYKLRRIHTSGRSSLKLRDARLAGIFTADDEERLAPFITNGNGSERYDIQKIGSGHDIAPVVAADDTEGVPF